MKTLLILGSLLLLLVVGSIQAIESSYESRNLMSQVQTLKNDRNEMLLNWSKLVLEESMLTDETIVYQFAEKKLNLVVPTSKKVVFTSR